MEYTKEEQERAFTKNVNIKVSVLVQLLNIINISCERGAFKADEMSFVGKLYDSINNGVETAMKIAKNELKN